MGISGLLQFLKQYNTKVKVAKYGGKTVAVDTSCWIHQAAYYADFSDGTEKVIQKIVNYIVKRLKMLKENKITPILVFDGPSIEVKKRTRNERAKNRNNWREKVAFLMKEGRPDEANRKFGESFTITSYIIQKIIESIKLYKIKYVIAPYEADSQLAYLFHSGKVQLVITEDSDLIAYGVTKLLYKMDNDGKGYELQIESLFYNKKNSDKLRPGPVVTKDKQILSSEGSQDSSQSQNSGYFNEKISSDEECKTRDDTYLINSTIEPIFWKENFLTLWILAGCDYLDPIKGIGFKTAYKLVSEHDTIKNVINSIRYSKKYGIPSNYLSSFNNAYMTFLFQPVYDIDKEKCVHLNEPNENDYYGYMFINSEDKSFWGQILEDKHAKDICMGNIDPKTKKPVNMDALRIENNKLNEPMWVRDEEVDKTSGIIVKECKSIGGGNFQFKKHTPSRKAPSFVLKVGKVERPRVPSPYKNIITGNLK